MAEPKFYVYNETDCIYADPRPMTRVQAERFIRQFLARFEQQGYYASAAAGPIPIRDVRLSLVPVTSKNKKGQI